MTLHHAQLLHIREHIRQARYENITAHIPMRSNCCADDCGYDEVRGGAKNPSCAICGGTGKVTTWSVSNFSARVMQVDPAHLRFTREGPVVTGEVGDASLQVDLRNRQVVEAVKNNPDAYFLIDDKPMRPDSITINRVSERTSLDVRCYTVKD